tara:strand:- start:665 stop:4051 length:3387 start_codon:yes stop_codon:yes gene_type:complete
MAETRARFLANTIGATNTSNDFTLPDGVGSENQVLSSDGAGGTTWANTLSAPTISSVTGTLNEYEDGVSEDGGVLTINGTDFGSDVSALSVQISGTTAFNTIAETSTISITTPGSVITATFTGAETNYNHSSFAAGSTIYVKVTKSGLQTSTYATLGTAMTGDPSFSTTSTTASTHTGTLATTSLGSYGGKVAGGGDDSNTKLLLNFDRGGGTDIEDSSNTGGEGHKITASGNAIIKASPFGDGKSAMYFDGVDGTKITVNSFSGISSGDFTFEFWLNCSDVDSDTHNSMVMDGRNSSNAGGFIFQIEKTNGQLFVYDAVNAGSYTNGRPIPASTNTQITENSWHHVALVRSSGTLKLYMDGVEAGSASNSSDFSSDTLTFGKYRGGDGYNFPGYIDEVRVVVGTAVYTGNFDVPSGRLSKTQSSGTNISAITGTATKLLIHSNLDTTSNTTFTDSSDSSHSISRTGVIHTTNHGAIAPAMAFPASGKATGSAGVYFDGTNDEVDISASSDLARDSNDPFTLELWFYKTQSGGQTIFESRNSNYSPQSLYINIQTAGQVFVRTNASGGLNLNGSGSVDIGNGRFYPNNNTWYHIAVCRGASGGGSSEGNVMRVYVNGRYIAKATDADLTTAGGHDWSLGHSHGTDDFNGYIDQVRWSNTVRYSHETLGSGNWPDSNMPQPTKIYGAYLNQDVGTIQLNATAGTGGGALDYAELSGGTALSTYGLSLSSSGAITGTLTGLAENSNSGGVIRIRARANADDNRVTTLGGSSFTGITQNAGKAPTLFSARRFAATGTDRTINGFGFQPDLIWIKARDKATNHYIQDSARGAQNLVLTNATNAEYVNDRIDGFVSDGVKITNDNEFNDGSGSYSAIAWAWKAGGAPSGNGKKIVDGTESNLTSGTDYSGVTNVKQSVNSSGGFSITQYTGNSSTAWIKHGLGASKPDFYTVKALGQTYDWGVWHSSFSTHASDFLNLHDNGAVGTNTGMWGNTGPTTDGKINFGNSATSNGGTNYIMYAWKAVSGVSAFGGYDGGIVNIAVDLGFFPKFFMTKRINSSAHWMIWDTFRSGASASGDNMLPYLSPNNSETEYSSNDRIDLYESSDGTVKGVQLKSTDNYSNASGGTYIYIAFA